MGGGDHEAHRRAQHHQPPLFRAVHQFIERLFVLLAEVLFDCAALALIIVGLEIGGYVVRQIVDHGLHGRAQADRHTGGQLDGRRLVRRVEIVDVDPVRRHGPLGRLLCQQRSQRAVPPVAGIAENEEVEIAVGNSCGQRYRLEGPVLPEQPHFRGRPGGLALENADVKRRAKLLVRQRNAGFDFAGQTEPPFQIYEAHSGFAGLAVP